jgi:L-amino acid N-acyltransferase YncA
VIVRDATAVDVEEIRAIYNDVMATSTAIYREEPATADEFREWFETRTRLGFPVLVAEENGEVLGYDSFADFRHWPGYRHTVEHSVHVRADARGRGIGRALLTEIIVRAGALGKHVLIAGIDADNDVSIRLHERLGFERVAHFREVGWKFDRWLDLVFMQRLLP